MQSYCRVATNRIRSLSFWSRSPPPYTEFSLVSPVPSSTAYNPDIIPRHILRPPYAQTGQVDPKLIPKTPVLWSTLEIDKIRRSCQLARKVLNSLHDIIEPGIPTEDIDAHARDLITLHNAYPSPLNFQCFPKSISTSVNNVAAHGIPDSRPLESGDILNIDVTVYLDGYHGDCSDTFKVGQVDIHADNLINVTRECLEEGIKACGPEKWLRGIGHAVQKHAKKNRCTTIPLFLGHGIGDFFHGPPDIYHCLNNYPGMLVEGMVFTVGPVLSEGDRRVRILEDGWTAVTVDNSRTAQVEHTVLITNSGVEILTQ
eukprot:TRINITY_DN12762_c0_g1_i1.p1 TRINITY_DN12762_c0_g1~~TRINITY_DN12762_c0_g1_i1.p1  ORF type:complete len:314 (+),score=78.91 TRINITY_DN12762_c0_g1_i1:64-1005(+)